MFLSLIVMLYIAMVLFSSDEIYSSLFPVNLGTEGVDLVASEDPFTLKHQRN